MPIPRLRWTCFLLILAALPVPAQNTVHTGGATASCAS